VAKAAWGTKRTCQSCGARFYDMRRDPIVCPKCQAVYDPELVLKARRGRATPAPDKVAAKPAVAEEAAEDLETADIDADVGDDELAEPGAEEEQEDMIEDASELGEDDDVSKVIEKDEGEEER
jgi:uncharacterized protein (TIGR02300 family)